MGDIIITGPDGAGKSTLAQALHRHLSTYAYLKASHTDEVTANPERLDLYMSDFIRGRLVRGPALWDRWYYPEDVIYRPLMDGQLSRLTWRTREIEQALRQRQSMFIYLHADPALLFERISARGGDTYVKPDSLRALVDAYNQFVTRTLVPTLWISAGLTREAQLQRALDGIKAIYGQYRTEAK